ncbi:hedgehog protein [Elysia marginata]|uniref:Hedgehog protein n=1 Tax=Elysia marginata TaxID=1093978 RepID=A0AAV4IMC2_9GAST|nr:hedgehog protein [Elysia marginata]
MKACEVWINNNTDENGAIWSFIIIPVPNSGDLYNTNNYRGISLMRILAKIYNMILNRIRTVTNPRLRMSQNGFRPGRSTVAQILTEKNYWKSEGQNPPGDHHHH